MTDEAPSHTQRHQARLESLVPGRVRLKMHPRSRALDSLLEVQRRLAPQDGIQEVSVNPATGSVVVKYDDERHSAAGMLSLLEDLDVVVESTVQGSVGPDFISAINDLNARIQAATGIPIDLKLALPLTFVAAGIWSISKKGLMVESVPGWFLLWLAFDMFVKLHPSQAPAGAWADSGRPSPTLSP